MRVKRPEKAGANCTRGPAAFAMGVFGAAEGALEPGLAVELCGALFWLSLGYAARVLTSPLGLRSFLEPSVGYGLYRDELVLN